MNTMPKIPKHDKGCAGWEDCHCFHDTLSKERHAVLLECARILKLVLPHIPPSAIDGIAAQGQPIRQCYLNTLARQALTKLEKTK